MRRIPIAPRRAISARSTSATTDKSTSTLPANVQWRESRRHVAYDGGARVRLERDSFSHPTVIRVLAPVSRTELKSYRQPRMNSRHKLCPIPRNAFLLDMPICGVAGYGCQLTGSMALKSVPIHPRMSQ